MVWKSWVTGSKIYQTCNPTSCIPHLASFIGNRSTAENHPAKIDGAEIWMARLGIMEIVTPWSHIPHPTSYGEEVAKGKYVETKIYEMAFCIPHPTILQICAKEDSSRKLSFSTKFLDRSEHSGHYRFGQSTLQLSSKCIGGKKYMDSYTCSYSKEQCINST